jgi:hypothetical protein
VLCGKRSSRQRRSGIRRTLFTLHKEHGAIRSLHWPPVDLSNLSHEATTGQARRIQHGAEWAGETAEIPPDLDARVRANLTERPETAWDDIVQEIVTEAKGGSGHVIVPTAGTEDSQPMRNCRELGKITG